MPVGVVAHRTSNGATISAPAASPSHHVNQMLPNELHAASPVTASIVTPIVALVAVLSRPASTTKRRKLRARSKACAPPAYRSTNSAPITASSVLPAAMPIELTIAPAMPMLTRNAPTKIAGQTRTPRSSTAASAIPVGGHTGEALAWTKAKCSPSLPARK